MVNSAISSKIIGAFAPVTELMKGLSYPACYVMMAVGILLMIMGNKRQGFQLMKWAGVGYIAMQFLPSLMRILSDIGTAMQNGS